MPIQRTKKDDFLGYGLSFPLKRQASDFVAMSGEDLVLSALPFILLTDSDGPLGQGEIPWDTEFGSQLNRLKFESIENESIFALVQEYVVEAIQRADPRIVVTGLGVNNTKIKSGGNRLEIEIAVSTIVEDNELNDVRLQGEQMFSFTFED